MICYDALPCGYFKLNNNNTVINPLLRFRFENYTTPLETRVSYTYITKKCDENG